MKNPTPPKLRKVTLMLPEELIDRAMRVSGKGLTQTVRESLEDTARKEVFKKVLDLQGTMKIKLDLDRLREDRDVVLR